MKQTKRVLALVLTLVLAITLITPTSVSAAKKVKLNKTKATIYVGKSTTLKLKNNKKKVKWSSSNKKVATVSKKGKVKGKKAGKATITAKVGKKKYKCKVIVKKKTAQKKNNASPVVVLSAKDKVVNACKTNGTYYNGLDGTYYYLSKIYNTEEANFYTEVQFLPSENILRIALKVVIGSGEMFWVYDILDEKSPTCPITFNDYQLSMYGSGLLYKTLLNGDSAVEFSSHNIEGMNKKIAENLSTYAVQMSLICFDAIMIECGVDVTHKDLGFQYTK